MFQLITSSISEIRLDLINSWLELKGFLSRTALSKDLPSDSIAFLEVSV